MKKNSSITASVKIKNIGKVKGKEIVQLYLQDPYASTTRPIKELKGFKTIELNAGEAKTVSFKIDEDLLKFYNAHQKWIAEPGIFNVFIGTNSLVKDKKSFELLR